MIHYVTGDATRPRGDGKKMIIHVCNDGGGWGSGFVLAVSARWKKPERSYRGWHGDLSTALRPKAEFKLGNIQIVGVEDSLYVINMIAQVRYDNDGPPIRYDALRECLGKVGEVARDWEASVHAPRIGCGLAGGSWDVVEKIIEEELWGLDVTVYDLPQ